MTRLACEAVTVRRGGTAILDRVSLAVGSGSFVALLGPNGAGKSTLLSCLAGLLKPDDGRIMLDDTDLATIGLKALAGRRAYLPQSPRAEWPVSVERLVALGLTPQLPVFGALPASLDQQVSEILAQVDLLDRRDQPATTLSGGELARAMLGRALIGNPDMLLVDEPLAGLDPRHAMDGMARLRTLAEGGKLVIASVHDVTLAARHATHVAVLKQGQLVALGETAAMLTPDLLRHVFEVDARVSAPGTGDAQIDFRRP